jgi:hypothetical protein
MFSPALLKFEPSVSATKLWNDGMTFRGIWNHHVSQRRHYHDEIEVLSVNDVQRILYPGSEQMIYEEQGINKSVLHFGQQKLLLSEVEFLTKYALANNPKDTPKDTLVVYAGASPSTHTSMLLILFPSVSFVLIDPAPFDIQQQENRVGIINELFTDDLVDAVINREYKPNPIVNTLLKKCKRLLFISDIRGAVSLDPEESENSEIIIMNNMTLQRNWVERLRPYASMLKFRLPWRKESGKTLYLKGDIYLQMFAKPSSAETRLVVEGVPEMVEYDHKTV